MEVKRSASSLAFSSPLPRRGRSRRIAWSPDIPDAGFITFLKIDITILKKNYMACSGTLDIHRKHISQDQVLSHLYFRAFTGICKRLPPSNGRCTVSSSAWSIRSASFRAHTPRDYFFQNISNQLPRYKSSNGTEFCI